MPVEIQVRQRPQFRRILIGAGLFVLGLILVRYANEGLGALCLLTGIVVGVRRSIGPIVTTLFGIAVVCVFVAWHFWIDPDSRAYGLGDYLRRNWWFIIYAGALVFGPIAMQVLKNDDAWTALRADFSESPDDLGEDGKYPAIEGLMQAYSEQLWVYVATTPDGLFIVKEDSGNIFFDWGRVKGIRVLDQKVDSMAVEIERKLAANLELTLPWDARFAKYVPDNVRLAGI